MVEDFLLLRPAGVEGTTLHAKAARYQQAAAEAAVAAGAGVFFNPATERLTGPDYVLREAPYYADAPYDIDAPAADPSARARLVAHVLAGHPASVTAATPPHFIVNVVLAADTLNSTETSDCAWAAGSRPAAPVSTAPPGTTSGTTCTPGPRRWPTWTASRSPGARQLRSSVCVACWRSAS